jgi:hypothetical protein
MMQSYPRWRILILLPAVLMIIVNLKVLGAGKDYYVEAGAWLSSNIKDASRVYNENTRMLHYARWYKNEHIDKENREAIGKVLAEKKYDYFVFDVAAKDPPIDPWLERNGFQVVQRFGRPAGDGIVVAIPARN